MAWEDISTAPKDGTIILAECISGDDESYLATVCFWTLDMLRSATGGFHHWKDGDEYWCATQDDFCVEPVRWLPGADIPESVRVVGYDKELKR